MSYCRFSSDDFQCDVYVYEDTGGGFTTHVAGRRPVYKKPLPKPVPMENIKKYIKRHNKVMAMLDKAELVDIGLPHDGDMFNDATAAECADRLEYLREIGYIVPQYAIDALREEIV